VIGIQNKNILITGGSSGIGAEFAKQFAASNNNLVLVARSKDKLENLKAELESLYQIQVDVYILDLGIKQDLESVSILFKKHNIDVLINNAGFGSFGYFSDLNLDKELEMLDVNVKAQMYLTHKSMNYFLKKGSGSMISVSSIAAFTPIPLMSTYAATKVFNFYHTLGVKREIAKQSKDIKISILMPGPTATGFGGVARVPGTVTGGARDEVSKVVSMSIKALEKNKDYIVTVGMRSKLLAFISRVLPFSLKSKMVFKMLVGSLK